MLLNPRGPLLGGFRPCPGRSLRSLVQESTYTQKKNDDINTSKKAR